MAKQCITEATGTPHDATWFQARNRIKTLEEKIRSREERYKTETDPSIKREIKGEIEDFRAEINELKRRKRALMAGAAVGTAVVVGSVLASGAAAQKGQQEQQQGKEYQQRVQKEMQNSRERFDEDYRKTCDKIKKDREEFDRQAKEFDKIFAKGLSRLNS